MKVGLVYPPSPFLLEAKVMPPLGILFVAASLERAGHEVRIADLTGLADWKDEMMKMVDWQPGMIGYTGMTPQYPLTLAIRQRVEEWGYDGAQVLGGIHATSDPEGVVRDPWHAVATGEGELSVLRMAEDASLGPMHRTYSSPLVPNLDEFGHPARHLVDIRSYKYELNGVPATTTFSQRGCKFRCAFCESPLAGGFQVRYHSVDWVEQEARAVQDLGFDGMHFFDDELNIDTKRLLQICERLAPYNMTLRGFFVASRSTPELLRAMKKAGFWELLVGFESGDPAILRNIHKPQTVDIMRTFARQVRESGIRWKAACIVGLPGESWESIAMTERMLEECRPDDVDFSILQVYPGSPIYRNADEYHREGLEWEIDYSKSWYKSGPSDYGKLVQVHTRGMSRLELVAARDYLEWKFKDPAWKAKFKVTTPTDRIDPDLEYVRAWSKQLAEGMP